MKTSSKILPNCYDCRAAPGQPHNIGCDVERCSVCGSQYLACCCSGHDRAFARWTGFWPGSLEEEALGTDLETFFSSGLHKILFVEPNLSRRRRKTE